MRLGGGRAHLRLIPVEVVPRHVHVSKRDWYTLFGNEAVPRPLVRLSQPEQAAWRETVTVVGPKGRLTAVRILGPFRRCTQVELTPSEAFALGIEAPERMSGSLRATPGCRLIGPVGEIQLPRGVFVPVAHVHADARTAEEFGWRHGARTTVSLFGPKGEEGTLRPFVRVHPAYRLMLHVHADEAAQQWIVSSGKVFLDFHSVSDDE